MKPTSWRTLLGIAAVALATGWVLVDVVERFTGRILGVPWLAAGALWVLASGLVAWAVLSRGRIGGRDRRGTAAEGTGYASPSAPDVPRRMPPVVAARTAALSLAASRTGALIGGFYLGIALGLLGVRNTPTGSAALAAAVACVVACAVMVGAALWLERLCRLSDGDDRA